MPDSSRWLEGWALVFPSVGIALLAAWLALPQGTIPDYLPQPLLRRRELVAGVEQLRKQAAAAYDRPLPYEIRAVGEALRQLGRLAHAGEPITVERRDRYRAMVGAVRGKFGDTPLLELRAVQAQLFVAALAEFERQGIENEDLKCLGGDFLNVATELGWLDAPRPSNARTTQPRTPRSLGLSDHERTALFLTRWNDLADLTEDKTLRLAPVWPLLALRARLRLPLAKLGSKDLRLVERVKPLDPDYPELISQGLLYVRLGDRTRAIEAFRSHLLQQPDGPHTLRARNHLIYALEKMNHDDG